ncbi:glycosyltransferase family 15 protein [Lyophyllum atratum]|nr:glycosyltransferase family 15 protein [Lyophyllum atratum]
MLTPRRFITVVLVVVLSLHFFLGLDYERLSSSISEQFWTPGQPLDILSNATELVIDTSVVGLREPKRNSTDFSYQRQANATFVLLCRNSDLAGVVSSIQQMEDRFNRRHNYPWVLLNEEPFTEEFKRRVSVLTDAPIFFGLIPREQWFQPDWIDESKAADGRRRMMWQGIIYAGSVPYVLLHLHMVIRMAHFPSRYRNMCRFNSGFFFHHELLKPYRYYWRPDVKFFCDVTYDPFLYMEDGNKVYGFTISLIEWEATIPTLWSTVKEFIAEYPQYVQPNNSMNFLSDNDGETYNLCHYWSNFEIADMDFWRGEAYQTFFDYLESKGGFYYERWGDAPVHSIAASLFARREQVHFFRDIGYRHDPFQHCPSGDSWSEGRCSCDPNDSFDYAPNSCIKRYENLFV